MIRCVCFYWLLGATAIIGSGPSFGQDGAGLVHIGALSTLPRQRSVGMTIATPKLAANGYQPLYLRLFPKTPTFPADRTFDVVLSPRGNDTTQLDFDFHVRCTVPQDSTGERFVVYVPYYVPWSQLTVQLIESGEPVEKGRGTFSIDRLETRYAEQHTSVGILHPSRNVANAKAAMAAAPSARYPDVRSLVTLLGDGPLDESTDKKNLSDTELRDLATRVQSAWVQFRAIDSDPHTMYRSWLGYSQLDAIIVQASTLQEIARHAEPFKALTDWIAAGGNLWIYDAQGFEFPIGSVQLKPVAAGKVADASAVRRSLDLNAANDTTPLELEHWGEVTKQSQNWEWQQLGVELSLRKEVFEAMEKEKHPAAAIQSPSELSAMLRTTRMGLGTITAIDDPYPFPGSFQLWQTVRDLYGPKQLVWTQRNGIDVRRGDDHYWKWLIEAVGGPPVKLFFALNTLFVIVIGPVGYLFFRRHARLHLLLFFAPALALLLTLGLFAYALLADGWQTRVRARQLTWQDTDAGYCVSQNRQTYFSSFGRADGIQLPDQTALFPIRNTAVQNRYRPPSNQSSRRAIDASETDYRYTGQFLPARTQVQYMTLQPQAVPPKIGFDRSDDSLLVRNQSAHPLACVIAADAKGQLWVARDVPAGEAATMNRSQSTSPNTLIDVAPLRIDSPVPVLHNDGYSNHSTNAELTSLEQQLNQWLGSLPNDHFLATTQLQSDALGVSDARTEGSVHVIMGELP
ncbi:hypothetical protein Poly24_19190 [Rosistilla carotiformis]|uniref:Uncharacterized protein n=1 Tax=Rosistilla carotiformis TaxID=2528017 RepID=A0A518JRQ1_9BACT|nr:hypothetical protein [Rosistilla carotiformis]QDV68210.1 hypothetical protein Poly24_19190 [Rosistilla carotiformis]